MKNVPWLQASYNWNIFSHTCWWGLNQLVIIIMHYELCAYSWGCGANENRALVRKFQQNHGIANLFSSHVISISSISHPSWKLYVTLYVYILCVVIGFHKTLTSNELGMRLNRLEQVGYRKSKLKHSLHTDSDDDLFLANDGLTCSSSLISYSFVSDGSCSVTL